MSADQVAAAVFGAAITLIVMGAAFTVALAFVYQGAHASPDARPGGRSARRYHRLSPDERRIWRTSGEHPVRTDGSWQVAGHA